MNTDTKPVLMDAGTLTALKESIAKWTRVAAGTEVAHGSDECALCRRFYPENITGFDWEGDVAPNNCRGCPVDRMTRGRGCIGTPTGRYFAARDNGDDVAMKKYALEELEFLRELLPPGMEESA